jgi:hypothetical protein
MEVALDAARIAAAQQKLDEAADLARRRKQHKRTKPQLLTRSDIDRRSNAAKYFDRMVTDIEQDLSGRENLSTIELALIEGFVGSATVLQNLNVRLMGGEQIDVSEHAQCVSGLSRRAKTVGHSLGELMRQDIAINDTIDNVSDGDVD